MSIETVKTVFDAAASTYDRTRRQLIPCFDEFYGTVLELLPQDVSAPRRLLDLGAGTGLLSLSDFPPFRKHEISYNLLI